MKAKGTNPRVVVAGGGTGGMSAALALADLGVEVLVVEKSAQLGGNAGGWACMATTECARCSACTVQEQARRVAASRRIDVALGARIAGVEGGPGKFKVRLQPSGQKPAGNAQRADWLLERETEVGAERLVLCTGFEPYDARQSTLLSYGRLAEVFTTRDVDHLLVSDRMQEFLPAGMDKPSIAFLQCVGSRDKARGRGYCSQFCCKATVRLAERLMHLVPEAKITVFYIDLQIMGKEFRSFHSRVGRSVRFVQGVPDQVDYGWDETEGKIVIRAKDPLTGGATTGIFDRVILSIGITPPGDARDLARIFGVDRDEYGFVAVSTGKASRFGTSREGVFAIGASIGPTDINSTRTQSLAAAAAIARELGVTGAGARPRT